MNLHHQKNSLKKLVNLIGMASASVFLSLPAFASLNPNSSTYNDSLNTRPLGSSRQLLAQGTSGTGQTGTSGAGTCQINTGRTTSNNRQTNRQQNAFTQYMNAGYAATQQRNYPNALACFQRALQLRPGNGYATQAIQNVQAYMQRNMQGGATTAPNQGNQGGTAPNQGGTVPNQGGTTTTPTNQGGTVPNQGNQGGSAPNQGGTVPNQGTTAPTNQGNR